MHAYARGSTRCSFEPVQLAQHLVATYGPDYSQNSTSRTVANEKNQPLRFTTPFYSTQNRIRIGAQASGVQGAIYVRSSPSGATNPVICYLSAADDFQCGYFLGAPPMDRLWTATNNLDTALNTALNQAWVS